jgi:hypothetical protein
MWNWLLLYSSAKLGAVPIPRNVVGTLSLAVVYRKMGLRRERELGYIVSGGGLL